MSRARADALERMASAELKQLQLAERRGLLAPIEEIRAAWSERARQVRESLEGLAEQATQEIQSELAIEEDTAARIEAILQRLVAERLRAMEGLRFAGAARESAA